DGIRDGHVTGVQTCALPILMWEHPLTGRHLRQLAADAGTAAISETLGLDDLILKINDACRTLRIVAPQSKRLACGDVGIGAMAEIGRASCRESGEESWGGSA